MGYYLVSYTIHGPSKHNPSMKRTMDSMAAAGKQPLLSRWWLLVAAARVKVVAAQVKVAAAQVQVQPTVVHLRSMVQEQQAARTSLVCNASVRIHGICGSGSRCSSAALRTMITTS